MTKFNDTNKPASAESGIQMKEPVQNRFEGKIISVVDNKLMVRNAEGKEHSHILAKDAKLTCDGQDCIADDLKAGSKIRVTTKQDDRNVATGVECIKNNLDFEDCCS